MSILTDAIFALVGITFVICVIATPVCLIGFIVQSIRKHPGKKKWLTRLKNCFLAFAVALLVAVVPALLNGPESDAEAPQDPGETEEVDEEEPVEEEAQPEEPVEESEQSQKPVEEEPQEPEEEAAEKTEAEQFAEDNDVSVELAESLETVLAGMELTDTSRVGIFHYELSHVYNWKQIEDWADGERYSAWMDMEHVWYIYVKDDVVVGVRDGHGNIFYEEETQPEESVGEAVEVESPEDEVDTSVSFEEIYHEYKQNELRADDTYQGNRYRITAEINGMETGGLLNLTGGAVLTMQIQVDNTIVFFYAEFEKDQEEALKSVNVGDTITFEGKCLSAGSWTDCVLITE